MSKHGLMLLVPLLLTSACGEEEDGGDNESSFPTDETDGTQETMCRDCCECDAVPPAPPPRVSRYVVTAHGEPIGYLVGTDGFLFSVLTADGENLLTVNSVTGGLTGPEYWHHDGSETGPGCSGPVFYPVTAGPCGNIEGMRAQPARVFSYFADPRGTFVEAPGSVMTGTRTAGGLTTYKLAARRSIVKHGWSSFCRVDEAVADLSPDELPEMCGLPLEHVGLAFASHFDTPIEIVETTEPLEAEPSN